MAEGDPDRVWAILEDGYRCVSSSSLPSPLNVNTHMHAYPPPSERRCSFTRSTGLVSTSDTSPLQ